MQQEDKKDENTKINNQSEEKANSGEELKTQPNQSEGSNSSCSGEAEQTSPQEEEMDENAKKIAQLEEKCKEQLDKYQRTLAEFDNFRKRTIKEKASMYDDGVRDTIEKLLPVVDNLERAVLSKEKTPSDAEDTLLTGIKMVLKQLKETLTALGVEEIKAMGEKFDPNLHAAVAHEESKEFGENEVMLEMLKGYKYKEKVIRHSMVKVAN